MSDFSVFNKRNIERNVIVKMNGIHNLFPSSLPYIFQLIFREVLLLEQKFKFYFQKKITIPQIEFILTNKCTLRCKHCAGYIPHLENCATEELSIEKFKTQFDNLTNVVDSIQNLLLTGGEPLLVKDLVQICEYALKNKKVQNLWIFTNGTIDISQDLLNIIKKYNNKIIIRISNYSNNLSLKSKLKYEKILSQIQETKCRYIYNEDKWIPVFEIKEYKRTREQNRKYFRACLHPCFSVYKGFLFVCPRSAAFYEKGLFSFENGEEVNINNQITKQQIINYYNRDYFSSCEFCDFVNERNLPLILPAEQLTEDVL